MSRALEETERFRLLVRAAVPHYGRDRPRSRARRMASAACGVKWLAVTRFTLCAPALQIEHHVRQLFGRAVRAAALLADRKVLAVDAAQGAPGKEDGPAPALAGDDRLLQKWSRWSATRATAPLAQNPASAKRRPRTRAGICGSFLSLLLRLFPCQTWRT